MHSRAFSLIYDAKSLVKRHGFSPSSVIIKKLTQKKISKRRHDNYSNNIFKFCRSVLFTNKGQSFFVQEFNSMLNFIESCDILDNCRSFIPMNAQVLSNVKELNSYKTGSRIDYVLLESKAVSSGFVVLDDASRYALDLANKNNIPVFLVSSVFNIDEHSIYSPKVRVDPSQFDGVISEHGFMKFDSFINNARTSFGWLFF
jgi:hypothetical protein